ncbi:MAG TPA: DUF3568 family protein [Desulfobacteraceae bacterium]|nr:DUF3568 family protein [Desulfobacteraceae bacterium]HPQ29381.1 DUF3568 family protein [Desulfobacteraceae bacterium]
MKNTVALFILLLISLPLISGCAAVIAGGAGAGTVAYIKGELQTNLDASLEKSVEATKLAVDNLKFIKISEQVDSLTGEIIARTAQDKKITIKLNKFTEKTTKISIRVGVFGDQSLSQSLLEEIKEEL